MNEKKEPREPLIVEVPSPLSLVLEQVRLETKRFAAKWRTKVRYYERREARAAKVKS